MCEIGEEIGEYLEFIKLRPEYLDMLHSKVADIKSISPTAKSGFIIAATFLNFFMDSKIPWVHIFFSEKTIVNVMHKLAQNENQMYEFAKQIQYDDD